MKIPIFLLLAFLFLAGSCLTSSGENPLVLETSKSDLGPAVTPAVSPHEERMELVFHDEFDGDHLNPQVWISKQYEDDPIKNATLRGPDNLQVKDGHLFLHVRKEVRERRGKKSSWTAAFVYTREPVDNNIYIETRFKPTQASGVNNAFWLAGITGDRKSYCDRYEIDCPETRLDIKAGTNIGRAHLAWHDWKTQSYIKDAKDKDGHIAQGIHVQHGWDEFNTWGVWIGEDEFIYYLNGKEVWNGKTHEKYDGQWLSGVGKFDRWFPDEEKRAYGKFGQNHWRYNGGYVGDRMNLILATMPWDADWSPLGDAASGTSMAVDYVRMFKPARTLKKSPVQEVKMSMADKKLLLHGEHSFSGLGIELGRGASASWPLEPAISSKGVYPNYLGIVLQKNGPGAVDFSLLGKDGVPCIRFGVDSSNALYGGGKMLANTANAYPSSDAGRPFFLEGRRYLLVVRLTPGRDGSSHAVSMCAYDLANGGLPTHEPYFHSNIDENGNTSINNGWQINQRDPAASESVAAKISVTYEGMGMVLIEKFRMGESFLSVLQN